MRLYGNPGCRDTILRVSTVFPIHITIREHEVSCLYDSGAVIL